jgi:hypothetical protein
VCAYCRPHCRERAAQWVVEVQSEYSERRNRVESEPLDEAPDPDLDKAGHDGGVDHRRLTETTAAFASMAGHLVSPNLDAMVKNIVARSSVRLLADDVAKARPRA